MKDTKARGWIEEIEGRLDKIEGEFKEQVNCSLRDLRIEVCPKCKHKTLNNGENVAYERYYQRRKTYPSYELASEWEYTCLTCGTKWEEESKTTKKIIKK